MTARQQVRVGDRRLGRDRAPIDATPAPTTGEMLQAARHKKGVDLYRAERDTKIRARYLGALEQSDGAGLPSPVYTKGFLRNYALYLGLDPEEILARWKRETVAPRHARPVVVAPPMPLAAPRRGFTFTPGLFVAVALSLVVIAFAGYVVVQVFRFSRPPALGVTAPAGGFVTVDADRYTLVGIADPGASVRIAGASQQTYTVTADAAGRWSREVPLTKGQNDFRIVATAPGTGRDSPPVDLILAVPLPIPSGGPTLPPGTAPRSGLPSAASIPATLVLDVPLEGATFSDGVIPIKGSTSGTSVTITADLATDAGPSSRPGAPSPGPASPGLSLTPDPNASGAPRPSGGSKGATLAPAPHTIVPVAGAFSDRFALTTGTWRLSVTASGANLAQTIQSRTVRVAISGLTLVVQAKAGAPWIKVWVDGTVAPGYADGRLLAPGGSETFIAARTITVRTGNAAGTGFVVNGVDRGVLGTAPSAETWLFQLGREPLRTASR